MYPLIGGLLVKLPLLPKIYLKNQLNFSWNLKSAFLNYIEFAKNCKLLSQVERITLLNVRTYYKAVIFRMVWAATDLQKQIRTERNIIHCPPK